MANTQGINYGARPITEPGMPPKLMYFTANTAQAIYRGQFVARNNSGQVQVIGTAGNLASCGIAWTFLDTNGASIPSGMADLTQGAYLPSSTDAQVGVLWDPDQLYIMEETTGGTAITAASNGLFVGFTYIATTGNTNTGLANTVIPNGSVLGDSTNLLQLVGLQNITNQDGTANAAGASAKWIVRIVRHQFGPQSLALGPVTTA